jgi:hypothetical protein
MRYDDNRKDVGGAGKVIQRIAKLFEDTKG